MAGPTTMLFAAKWWSIKAATQGNALVQAKEALAARMTPAQVAQADKLSADWESMAKR